jgi:hypothetical protein
VAADFLEDFNLNDPLMPEFVQEIFDLLKDDGSNLNPFKDCECFEFKQKFKKKGKSSKTLKTFYIIMGITFLFNAFIIFPQYKGLSQTWVIVNYVFFILSSILNFILSFKDPGLVRLQPDLPLLEINGEFQT